MCSFGDALPGLYPLSNEPETVLFVEELDCTALSWTRKNAG